MFQVRPGSLFRVFDGVSATASKVLPCNPWGRDLLILHQITGETAGRCGVELTPAADGAVRIPHHGAATNLPTDNQTASYAASVRDVSEYVVLTLTVAPGGTGTHTVWVQYLA